METRTLPMILVGELLLNDFWVAGICFLGCCKGSWLYLGHKSINCRHLAEWINQMPPLGATSSSPPTSFGLQGRASLLHLLHQRSLFWEEFLIASNSPLAHKLITTGADHQLRPGPTYPLSGGLKSFLPPWKMAVVHFPLQAARTSRPFTPWDLDKTGTSSSSFVRLVFLFRRAQRYCKWKVCLGLFVHFILLENSTGVFCCYNRVCQVNAWIKLPGITFCLDHLLEIVWLLADDLTSLSITFLICKRVVIVLWGLNDGMNRKCPQCLA